LEQCTAPVCVDGEALKRIYAKRHPNSRNEWWANYGKDAVKGNSQNPARGMKSVSRHRDERKRNSHRDTNYAEWQERDD
jgi:hypothetical protein